MTPKNNEKYKYFVGKTRANLHIYFFFELSFITFFKSHTWKKLCFFPWIFVETLILFVSFVSLKHLLGTFQFSVLSILFWKFLQRFNTQFIFSKFHFTKFFISSLAAELPRIGYKLFVCSLAWFLIYLNWD